MTVMPAPRCRLNIDSTDYDNIAYAVNIKNRECNYDVASIVLLDDKYAYTDTFSMFDEVKIYFKDASDVSWGNPVFGGYIREKNPLQSETNHGLTLNCKGYGAALEATNCNRDYGAESSHVDWDYPDEILANAVADMINKSFGDTSTGYALTYDDQISDFCNTQIKYINNPYRNNLDLVNTVCQLTSAIGAGTSAGGHWIVDSSKRFLFGQIGDHTAETATGAPATWWPDWWNTNQAGSTLSQVTDFQTFTILEKTEEYANNVILVTDFRRPSYDVYTEGGVANGLWDYSGTTLTDLTGGAGTPPLLVGSSYVDIENAEAWLPASEDAGWDITKWGSHKSIPRLNFYMYKNDLVNNNCLIKLFTTSHSADYFYCDLSTLADPDDEWIFKSIPIGPYWASTDEQRKYRWTASSANADWSDINGLSFYAVDNGVDPGYLCLDDLHFTGKIVRSAMHTQAITAYKEHQKILIARNSMDDSCTADDDTGFAGRIAYAELLRRIIQPKTIMFTTNTNMKTALAGQKIHVQAGLKTGGTYSLDSDMRIIELEQTYTYPGGYQASVTATTDLKNSFPVNIPDQYAMWQENMFRFSSEAKNVRSGAEVDLLIERLIYDYGP